MREATRWTTKYQFWGVFLAHLEGVGVSFVFLAAAFYMLITRPVFKEILSAVFITVYFGMVYSRAHKFASLDAKDYTNTKQSIIKGVLFGCLIAATYALLWIIYKTAWTVYGDAGMLTSAFAWVISIIFWIYTIPYNGIMGLSHGNIMWYAKALMIIIPILATTLGYFAGMKKFKIMDIIGSMIYEKK